MKNTSKYFSAHKPYFSIVGNTGRLTSFFLYCNIALVTIKADANGDEDQYFGFNPVNFLNMAVFLRLLIALVVVLCLVTQTMAQDVEMRTVSGEGQGRSYAVISTAAAGKYMDLEKLIAEGHDVNEADERGLTAAHQAAFYRRHEALGEVCRVPVSAFLALIIETLMNLFSCIQLYS